MTMIQRRALLGALAGSASGLLAACGGGGSEAATMTAAPESGAAAAPVSETTATISAAGGAASPLDRSPLRSQAVAAVGRYRSNQPYLFQTVKTRLLKNRLTGGSDFLMDQYGPTSRYVDFHTGWPWTRAGGDWIDAALVRHGSQPWFSAPVGAALGGAAIARYTVDVTRAVAHCQVNKRWCALLLNATAPRAIAGMTHASEPAPYLLVTYQNGMQARLNCRLVAGNSASSTGPLTMADQVALPAFTEFEPPAGTITKALLFISLTQHWSGSNPKLQGFIIDPPINNARVQTGVAAAAGALDAGLATNPSIIGLHRYLDGTSIGDFALQEAISINAEKSFDPAIFGTGPTNLSKLPHRGLGKFISARQDMALVPSSYSGEGFAPLARGLGALRLAMPATPGVRDGSTVGHAGTLAGDAMIYLPEALFGRLPRIFVRYYVRLGTPAVVSTANRPQVYNAAGISSWTTCAGKFGIGADHSTSYGGVSGSSGGGNGWQMRHAWYDCDGETGGPDEGGWAPGFHMFDYYYANPVGHNYGKSDGTRQLDQWGQQGGLGGMFYAGQWYCVETEVKLNSVSDTAPGFLPDGALRVWVDGRLAYERSGMVFRTGPINKFPYNPDRLRPCRELGVRGLWLNWFHGGKTPNTVDRTLFYTGLAYGQSYIGPMNL